MEESNSGEKIRRLEERLRECDRSITIRDRRIRQLERHLELIETSKVWRAAEWFRFVVYLHWLRRFPWLQQHVMPVCYRFVHRRIFPHLVRFGLLRRPYDRWMDREREALEQTDIDKVLADLDHRPVISLIMPVYNVRPEWLEQAIRSVREQLYGQWELCIADDCSTDPQLRELLRKSGGMDKRIRVRFLDRNLGIAGASNAALEMAGGEFVGFLDHDDELAPDALLEVVRVIDRDRDVDCIYSDEDKISEQGQRYDPFFKPDWSPDTLRSYNYLCHFTVIRKRLVDEVGGFRPGYEGSQDYDLFLRVTERTRRIVHIPKILYHWRAIEGSVGKQGEAKMYAYESAKKALADHLGRVGYQAEVEDGLFLGSYHIKYHLEGRPEIAIIIPTKDNVDVLRRCLDSIISRSTYKQVRIVLVDNGSTDRKTFSYYESLREDENIVLLHDDRPFNFSAINNLAVERINADYLLFLNNDTEVISPGWLEEMLGLAQRSDVGAVGGLLYYSDNTVQHGGIIVGIGGVAGHAHKYFPREDFGYFGRLKVVQNVSAVTAACLMTRRSVFEEIGGFEEVLSHAFNDVDLCLRIREKGYLVVYTPFAQLYHHESLSRGYENTKEKRRRFDRERLYCEERWVEILEQGDPYYNPNLSLVREDFSI